MLELDEDCNMVFFVGAPKEMICRKEILAALSPVFYKMLYGPNKEDYDELIQLPDIDPDAFEMFLEFAYNEKIDGIDMAKIVHSKDATIETKLNAKSCKENNQCEFCVQWKRFLEKFYELCYCAEKYLVPSFKKYCVAAVEDYPNIPDELLISVYSGAFLVQAENLIRKCEEQMKKNPPFFLNQSSINKMNVDNFCHFITFLYECYQQSREANFYKDLFVAIDNYAAIHCNLAEGTKEEEDIKNQLKELFNRLLRDEGMSREELGSSPVKTFFL